MFTHSSVHGTFELLPLFGYYEHSCPSSCVNANFSIFLCIYLPYSTYVLRNCQTVFQRGSTILSGIVILVGGKWYFLIVLTSISLRTNYGWASFHLFTSHVWIFFGAMSIKSFVPFLYMKVPYAFWIQVPYLVKDK